MILIGSGAVLTANAITVDIAINANKIKSAANRNFINSLMFINQSGRFDIDDWTDLLAFGEGAPPFGLTFAGGNFAGDFE